MFYSGIQVVVNIKFRYAKKSYLSVRGEKR